MRAVFVFVACGLIGVCGCGPAGPQRAEVRGTVKFNGEPIEEGVIRFLPVEGTTGPDAGVAIKNGSYHLPRDTGPLVGKARVELRAFKASGKKVQDPTKPAGTFTYARVQIFPPEYSDKSTLIKEIKAGENEIDFDVRK